MKFRLGKATCLVPSALAQREFCDILNQVQELVGDVLLGGEGDFGAFAVALENEEPICLGGETATRGSDIIGAKQVAIFARQLVGGIGGQIV